MEKSPETILASGEMLILPLLLKATTAETSALKLRNTRDDSKIMGH